MTREKTISRSWRLGNFSVKERGSYLEASDFGGLWKMKVHKGTVGGMNLLFLCVHSPGAADIWLKLMWAAANIIPDSEYLEALWKAWQERLSRLPKEEQDDREALEELERLEAFLDMPQGVLEKELDEAAREYGKAASAPEAEG